MSCCICGGMVAVNAGLVPNMFLEGFVLGVLAQRISTYQSTPLVSVICAEHLVAIREMVAQIPDSVIAPQHRGALLNFGLAAV